MATEDYIPWQELGDDGGDPELAWSMDYDGPDIDSDDYDPYADSDWSD